MKYVVVIAVGHMAYMLLCVELNYGKLKLKKKSRDTPAISASRCLRYSRYHGAGNARL